MNWPNLRRPSLNEVQSPPKGVPFNPATDIPGLTFLADWLSPAWQALNGTSPATTDGQFVARWDDLSTNAKNVVAQGANNTAPIYRPAGGPSTGKYGLEWDGTNTKLLYNASGSTIITGTTGTIVAVVNGTNNLDRNHICGRGGYDAEGFTIQFQSDSATGICRGSGGTTTLTEPVAATGSRKTIGLSYDGTNVRFLVRGGTLQSAARAGAFNFAPTDVSFSIGGTTSDGTGFVAFTGPKTIGLVLATSTGYDDAGLAALLDQIATYAGLA
jgi:hypothetical protein